MTAKPIVPSKDVLRALRNLIRVTTPGSYCAVAAVDRSTRAHVGRRSQRELSSSRSVRHDLNNSRVKYVPIGYSKSHKHGYATAAAAAQVADLYVEELNHSQPLSSTSQLRRTQRYKPKSVLHDETGTMASLSATKQQVKFRRNAEAGDLVRTVEQPPTDLHTLPLVHSICGALNTLSDLASHSSAVGDSDQTQTKFRPPNNTSQEKYSEKRYTLPPFFGLETSVPVVSPHHWYAPICGELPDAEYDRYSYVYNYFLHILESEGMELTTRQLIRIMELYAATEKPEDWRLVELLHRTWSQHFRRDVEHRQWWPLIKQLLQQDPPDLNPVSLFYIMKHESTYTRHKLAQLYLVHFCRENSNLDAQIKETYKILDGTKLCGIEFSGRLIGPVIASAVRNEGPDTGLQVLEKMLDRCNMEPNRYLLAEIARGYALNRNWSKFESFVADSRLIEMDLARSKPLTFAAIVKIGLQEFAEHHSADQTYDFLTHYMHNHALVPDYRLSSVALQVFVEARRFDLVQRWTRERRKRFPLLDVTTAKVSPAYDIATGWYVIRASCTDVLNTCLALAHGEVQDPFSPELRLAAEEPILFDLHKRCSRLLKTAERATVSESFPPRHDWRSMCNYALGLADRVLESRPKCTKTKFGAQDLKRQIAAVRELESLFAGQYTTTIYEVPMTERSKMRAPWYSLPQRRKAAAPDWPTSLQYAYLPRRSQELIEDITTFFEGLEAKGSKPKHGILMYVAARLTDEDRPREACRLLRHFHNSRWVTKQSWDIELYTRWLEAASLWRDPSAVREVLWAVVDSSDAIRLTGRFLLLLRIAQTRTHPRVVTAENGYSMDEMAYLAARIQKRKWQQDGCPSEHEDQKSRFPSWSLVPNFSPSGTATGF